MKNNYPKFLLKSRLTDLIEAYFSRVESYQPEGKATRGSKTPIGISAENESKEAHGPATIAGLAFYLGFNSREQFESYESNGKFAACIKRACLRIEEVYEKKLHQQSSGVIFALKTLGWNEKSETKKSTDAIAKTMRVVIVETSSKPAANEKSVDI
ncbi:MAG: terminase small subunit [Mucilaginibacter sp.]